MTQHNVWQTSNSTVTVNSALGLITDLAIGNDTMMRVTLDTGQTIFYPVSFKRLEIANRVGAEGLAKLQGHRGFEPPPGAA